MQEDKIKENNNVDNTEMEFFDEDHDRRSWLVLKRMIVYILLIVLTPISVCVLGKVYIFESILNQQIHFIFKRFLGDFSTQILRGIQLLFHFALF